MAPGRTTGGDDTRSDRKTPLARSAPGWRFGLDPNVSLKTPKLNMCVVTGGLSATSRREEIDHGSSRLANLLSAAGHRVTILETVGEDRGIAAPRNVSPCPRIVSLPEYHIPLQAFSRPLAISYRVYEWLKTHDEFDVVHFEDRGGAGYYSICGQRQGLILQKATTVVGLHGASGYLRATRGMMIRHASELEVDFIERRAAELADTVWSVSHAVLDWTRSRDWKLPESVAVRPYATPVTTEPQPRTRDEAPVREIVYIGGAKSGQSLMLFLDAVELLFPTLDAEITQQLQIVITGPFDAHGECSLNIIQDRIAAWPIPCELIADWDSTQAIKYLREPGRLGVIVSLSHPRWSAVLDALAHGVPFVTTDVGNIAEVIDPASRASNVVAARAVALKQRLERAIADGHAPARPSINLAANNYDLANWHEQLGERGNATANHAASATITTATPPTVSLCITHFNRPKLLRQALRSVAAQTERPHEVIIIDDGSPAAVQPELDLLQKEFDFESRGWRLVRQENKYLGAARNRAVAEATRQYILFMDDDNLAKPDEVATFIKVATHTNADVYTCLFDSFDGDRQPFANQTDARCLYTGPDQALSVLRNTFGDANALFRREAILGVGGFSEDFGVGHEDWEMFERLMLAGYRMEVIPEALFHYRTMATSMVRTSSIWRNHLRSLRPHFGALPPSYQGVLELLSGQTVMHWVGACRQEVVIPWSDGMPTEADDEGMRIIHSEIPLRYKIADAINARLKRVRQIHRLTKRVVGGGIRLSRRTVKAVLPRPWVQAAKSMIATSRGKRGVISHQSHPLVAHGRRAPGVASRAIAADQAGRQSVVANEVGK